MDELILAFPVELIIVLPMLVVFLLCAWMMYEIEKDDRICSKDKRRWRGIFFCFGPFGILYYFIKWRPKYRRLRKSRDKEE